MSLATVGLPAASNLVALRQAWRARSADVRENGVIPIIITVAIVVLLAIAVSIVAAAIILCAQHGAVLDTVVQLNTWTAKVRCHKV